MCVEVFTGNGPEIGTPRELAAYLSMSPDDLPKRPEVAVGDSLDGTDWRDCCLCPIDVVRAVIERGFWIQREPSGGYNVRRDLPETVNT